MKYLIAALLIGQVQFASASTSGPHSIKGTVVQMDSQTVELKTAQNVLIVPKASFKGAALKLNKEIEVNLDEAEFNKVKIKKVPAKKS